MADSYTRALAIRRGPTSAATAAQVRGPVSHWALRTLSTRLLDEAIGTSAECSADVLAAAEYSFVELGDRLCRLVGPNGYRALVGRAIRIAAADFPLLSMVRPGVSPPGRLVGWQGGARGAPVNEVHNAVAATLAALLWLLEQFIGHDLTQRVLVEIWPWASSGRDRRREQWVMSGG